MTREREKTSHFTHGHVETLNPTHSLTHSEPSVQFSSPGLTWCWVAECKHFRTTTQ